jgi:hypothetical protein
VHQARVADHFALDVERHVGHSRVVRRVVELHGAAPFEAQAEWRVHVVAVVDVTRCCRRGVVHFLEGKVLVNDFHHLRRFHIRSVPGW